MNDDSLKALLNNIRPKILNIEENRLECSKLKSVHETMNELVTAGGDSYKKVLSFYDQDFILKAIKIGNSNSNQLVDKYKTAKYVLDNESIAFQELPQFKESITFMEQLYEYLYNLNKEIELEYNDKTQKLQVQELLNKYYYILRKNDMLIKDIDEFITFLNLNNLPIETKFNILFCINKRNIKNYLKTNDVKIGNDLSISNVIKLINQNRNLIGLEYDNKNLEYDLISYLSTFDDYENALNNRKIYLINILNKLYLEKKYNNLTKYYQEFCLIKILENDFLCQKRSDKKLAFMFKNGESLVKKYIDNTSFKYQSCIFKNLLDLETNTNLVLPKICYNNKYIYIKDEFVVKTIYAFDKDYILVLGVLDKGEVLEDFIKNNKYFIDNLFENIDKIDYNENYEERNNILKNIKLSDLVVSIDLDTLDIKMEDNDGR